VDGPARENDNCQVAVFAAVARGNFDAELYLPQEWVKDPPSAVRQIQQRHRQRQAAIDSAYRRQKAAGSLSK
jgi:hypothetical protein